jgi:hypothetical protein
VLSSLGIPSAEAKATPANLSARAVLEGILVSGGRFHLGASPVQLEGARICSVSDIGVTETPRGVSAEQASVISAFNEVTARLAQLSQRLEAVESQFKPADIDKPAQKNKLGPANGG